MPHPVTIMIDSRIAAVQPALADELGPLLSYDTLNFAPRGDRLTHRSDTVHVYDITPDDRLLISVGCVPRVMDELRRLGHEVRIIDHRRRGGHALAVEPDSVAEADRVFFGFAEAVDNHALGTIIVQPRSRADVIGTIARLYPDTRICVACATRREAEQIAADLAYYVGGNVEAVHGHNWRSPCRVVCITFASLDRSQPRDWPIVIFADANDALGRATHEARAAYGNSRIYALATPGPSSPKDQLLREVLAGPVIYECATTQTVRPPVIEVTIASYSASALRQPASPREQHQQLWGLAPRNRTVAELATACASADIDGLRQYGLFLADDNATRTLPPHTSALVVAASTEQARHIGRHLPDWPILDARPASTDAATARWGVPPRAIITMVRAEQYQHLHADIVIVAGGGPLPQLPTALAKHHGPLLLIDLADDYHDGVLADSQERLRVYADLGYHVLSAGGLTATKSTRESSSRRNRNTSRRPYRHRH